MDNCDEKVNQLGDAIQAQCSASEKQASCGDNDMLMDAHGDVSGLQGKCPGWVRVMLKASQDECFFGPCASHEDLKKNEVTLFCATCSDATLCCQHCLSSHQGHQTVQIRRYVYQDVVRAVDINPIVDVGSVQAYIINQAKVVFLNARPQAKVLSDSNATAASDCICRNCNRGLREGFLYCCLACKVEAIDKGLDVATGSSDHPPLEPYIPGPTKFGSAVFRKQGGNKAAAKKRDCCDHGSNEAGGSSSDPEPGSYAYEGSGVGDHQEAGSEENEPPIKRPSVAKSKGTTKREASNLKKKTTAATGLQAPPSVPLEASLNGTFLNQDLLTSFCPPGFFPFHLLGPSAAALFNPMLLSNGVMFPSMASAFQPVQTFPLFSGAWSMPSDLSCLLAQPNSDKDNNSNGNRDSNATSIPVKEEGALPLKMRGSGVVTERSSGSSNSEDEACPATLPQGLGHSSPLDCGALKNKRKMGLPKRSAA